MGNRATHVRDEAAPAAVRAEHSESSEGEEGDAMDAVVAAAQNDAPPYGAPSLVWSTINTVSASIKNFAPRAYVRDGMNLALSSVTTTRLRRKTLVGAELELATFVCQTTPVDFTQMLSLEMVLHIARFVDGEDLLALERTCTCLNAAVADSQVWQSMLEAKRRQITFVPFISESQRVAGCRNWEAKHRYFKSCVWNAPHDLGQALLVAEHSPLGGELHLLEGTYRSLLLEGWSVDLSIIGHGDVVIENTSAWRPPIHVCSESSLNPSTFMREQLSYVARYMPESLSRIAPVSSYILPEYLSSLFRKPAECPTIVLEGLRVQVGASAEQISTFPIYVEGHTHVVVHRCVIVGQRLSAILVSKGALCDVIDSDIGHATEDGVFYVFGGGSVRGCRIHHCAMNAVEVRGASSDVVVENNVITSNGCGLHVPWKDGAAATGLMEVWNGKIHFQNNQVFDNMGPSMRVEKCADNPHMGSLAGNVVFGNAEQKPKSAAMQRALDRGLCTRVATQDQHDYQPWFECVTCKLDGDHMESGICQSCVVRCHSGHKTFQSWTHTRSFCDCALTAQGCQCQEEDEDEEKLSSFTTTDAEYDVF